MRLKNKKNENGSTFICTLISQIQAQRWAGRVGRKNCWMDIFFPSSSSPLFVLYAYFSTSMHYYWLMEWVTRIQSICCCPAQYNGKWMEWGACWEPECQESHLWPFPISWHIWYSRSELRKPHNPSPPARFFFLFCGWLGANPCNRMQWRFAVGKLSWD